MLKFRFLIFASVCLTVAVLTAGGLGFLVDPPENEVEDSTGPGIGYAYQKTACWFTVSWREDIECGFLQTPGEVNFELPVVVLKADSLARQPDPLVYLQGGPGASAGLDRKGIDYWLDWADYAGLKRDLILMDRRGVGRSRPSLECPAYDAYSKEALRQNLSMEQEIKGGRKPIERCFARFREQGLTLNHFGTDVNAQDLRGLMSELPYEQWNLLGVSYGSRMAMALLRDQELGPNKSLRSVILDSVYPPNRGGLESWPRVLTQALERYFAWCEARSDCWNDSGMQADLDQALDQLRREPVTQEVALWGGNESIQVVVNHHRFLAAVFAGLYQRAFWPEIAQAVRGVLAGEPEAMQLLLESFVNNALSDRNASLVFMAVDCQDHPPQPWDVYQLQLNKYPHYAPYLEPALRYQACHYLSTEPQEKGPDIPNAPDLPILVLAGTQDPITPLSWARNSARHWPQAQLVEFPDTGHSVIASDDCAHRRFTKFLNQPHAQWVASCEK